MARLPQNLWQRLHSFWGFFVAFLNAAFAWAALTGRMP
jgi:hypothetical protein